MTEPRSGGRRSWRLVGLLAATTLLAGCAQQRQAQALTVEVQAPATLRVGQQRTVTLKVTNADSEPVTIRDLDLPRSLTDREPPTGGVITVQAIEPPHQQRLDTRDYRVARVNQEVLGGATVSFRLLVVGDRAGEVDETIDVAVGNFYVQPARLRLTVTDR